MPHSTSPETENTPNGAEQTMADVQSTSQNEDGQINHEDNNNDDNDVDMTEAEEKTETKNPSADIQNGGDRKDEMKLEDMFSDDSDDEFPSSRPNGNNNNNNDNESQSPSGMVAPSSPVPVPTSLKSSDPELMRTFYQRLFPWKYLFRWLNHGPKPTNDFGHREFAFTMPNDQYWRYQSYPTDDLLRKDVLRHMPTRFEIGPVYSANPRDRKTLASSSAFRPVSKELCFDIDLTDYDDVRTCCDKANICLRCWSFITMAIKVVDAALRDDFGFRHILWVYSGRRGAHAWVCDKKARTLDDQKRRAIAGYLEVVRGGAQAGKRVNLWRPLHPHISRSLDILAPYFQTTVLETQDPWADRATDSDGDGAAAAASERLLSLLPDKALNAALRSKWESSPGRGSSLKWGDIDAVARTGASRGLDARALREAKQDVVLEYTYPRLDIEVSKKLNHLLKSPFVVHPGTGRVCVPIDTTSRPDAVDRFDPLTAAPTVQDLVAEIDAWRADDDAGAKKEENGDDDDDGDEGPASAPARRNHALRDWEKTSLRPHIEYFRSFVMALERDEQREAGGGGGVRVKREREEGMDF